MNFWLKIALKDKIKMIQDIGRHLYAEEQPLNKIHGTKSWEICSKYSNITLGVIYWHNNWKQYVLEPLLQTVYSVDYMENIIQFINQQLKEKKENENG